MEQEDFSKYNGEGTILRKAQLRMLDILVAVDKICKSNGIQYWIESGTLLGAVRHGGFIPWDDDIDIFILQKDYKKARKNLVAELPPHLIFDDSSTDKCFNLVCGKVKDSTTIIEEKGANSHIKHQHLFIDIIPVEPMFSEKSKRMVEFLYGRVYRRIHNADSGKIELIVAYMLCPLASFIVAIMRIFAKIVRPKYLGRAYGWPFVKMIKYSDVFPCSTIKFEGYDFPCPQNVDHVLTDVYGDYMQIPPEDKREVHALKIEFLDE
ncbi:MAG: LicD family protein [Bacteroidales bacterium]|nr:LicD family protein [Bacteroidales bacterium]